MNAQSKTPPATPSEVTKVYNAKQDATGLTLLRMWVPAELLPAIRRELEEEKAAYLIDLADECGPTDERVVALAQRNIAAPMGATEIAELRERMAKSDNAAVVEAVEGRLKAHADAAANSERAALQARLADREGDSDEATTLYAKAAAYGYLVRFIKSEIVSLAEAL